MNVTITESTRSYYHVNTDRQEVSSAKRWILMYQLSGSYSSAGSVFARAPAQALLIVFEF